MRVSDERLREEMLEERRSQVRKMEITDIEHGNRRSEVGYFLKVETSRNYVNTMEFNIHELKRLAKLIQEVIDKEAS